MADKKPEEGMYVVILDLQKNRTSMGKIKFIGDRSYFTVTEILDAFSISIDYSTKVWIKQLDQDDCRLKDFERTATLPWEYFNNCVIVLAHYRPAPEIFQNYHQSLREKQFEDELKAQQNLWQEKEERKADRGRKIPLYVALKNKMLSAIKKRKTKARIEAAKSADKKDDDEK